MQARRHVVERAFQLADLVAASGPQSKRQVAAGDAARALDEAAHRIEDARREDDAQDQSEDEHHGRQSDDESTRTLHLDRELVRLEQLRDGQGADAHTAAILQRQVSGEVALQTGELFDHRVAVAAELHVGERRRRHQRGQQTCGSQTLATGDDELGTEKTTDVGVQDG